jgi:hypothetical protein
LRRKKVWNTGHILKIEINFQSEAKPQHEKKNGLETYNAETSKQESFQCQLDSLLLTIH